KQTEKPDELGQAYFYLAQVLRLLTAFDESRSKFADACKQRKDPILLFWDGRIDGLTDEAELDRTRLNSVTSALDGIAQELKPRSSESKCQWIALRASGYAKVLGGNPPPFGQLNRLLGLPEKFPAELDALKNDPDPTLRLFLQALVWVEYYV